MADPFNPYAPNQQPVNQRHRQQTTIRDFSSNQVYPSGEVVEDTRIDPSGGRDARTTRTRIRTPDGRFTDDVFCRCPECRRDGLHPAVMRPCMYCGDLCCLRCLNGVEDEDGAALLLCGSCYREWRGAWFRSITPSIQVSWPS